MNRGVPSGDDRRALLERQANARISRLIRIVDSLNYRRHSIQEVGREATRFGLPAMAALLSIAFVAAGAYVGTRYLDRRRRRRRLAYRIGKWLEASA